jgi:tRNA(fMet)-specific endonuclease VapC
MIGYLLDTCVISDFVKGDTETLHRIKHTAPNLLSISTITSMEIEFGLQLNPARAKIIAPVMSAILANIHILSYSEADAHAAAAIRANLQKRGTPIGAYDVLLAGCAVSRGLILVSSNTKEFQRISGLQLENWRS